MRRWIALGVLGLALSLAQTESVVHSPDGQLRPLTFGAYTCIRVMHQGQLLGDPVCVDRPGGAGVFTLRLPTGALEVPYRAEPALGKTSILIRLGSGWPQTPAAASPPATPASLPVQPSGKAEGVEAGKVAAITS